MSPNPELMSQYGTDAFYRANLEKRSEVPLLMSLLGPMGTAALMASDSKHRARQAQEAQLLNHMFQQLEAQRQEGVKSGLSGKGQMLSTRGQAAGQLNDMAAYQSMMGLMKHGSTPLADAAKEAMDKEAFGAAMVGGIAKGLSKMVGGAKKAVGGLKSAPKAVAPKVPGVAGTQGVAQAAQAAKGPGVIDRAKNLAGALKPGWKGKAALALGGGAAAYTGYKGLQATRDYMMQPTYTSNAWGGRGMMRGGVNQYGYTNPS